MIFVGLGSNLSGPWGTPKQCVRKAVEVLKTQGIGVLRTSSVYTTMAYGKSGEPDYANTAIKIATHLPPDALLKLLHRIERIAARSRGQRWGARTLDIDLLDWHGRVCGTRKESGPIGGNIPRELSLPHPGILYRPFVIIPLAEIAPQWHHPITGATAAQLAAQARRMPAGRVLSREAH